MIAHDEMLDAVREIRERTQITREKLSIVAAGMRNWAQPVLVAGEEDRELRELVDVAKRMVEIADELEGRGDVPRSMAPRCPKCGSLARRATRVPGWACDGCGAVFQTRGDR